MKNILIKNNNYFEHELIYKNDSDFLRTVDSLVELQGNIQAATYPNKKYHLTKEDIEKDKLSPSEYHKGWLKNKEKWGKEYLGLLIYTKKKQLVGIMTAYKNIFTYTNPLTGKDDLEILKVWLGNLFIDKSFQNKGIGKYLMNRLIEWANGLEIGLEVIEYNTTAIKFYEKFGFQYAYNSKEGCEYNGKVIPELTFWRKSE